MEKCKNFAHRVRKTRMMGSAALALAYIACGRLDAYVEEMISIWDIAAGKLMLERGGGKVELSQSGVHSDRSGILSHNGKLNFDGLV
jgi:myo-inositol-1(or 4)-monophosphatase